MKPGYVVLTRGTIENHLIPIFGRKDLPELREADCLRFASMKLDEGLAPKTIKNALSIVRCVCSLLERDGLLDRNPAKNIGELVRKVIIERWRREYNTFRPHSSLGYRPPASETVPWPGKTDGNV